MRLSIVVINYNTRDLTLKCIRSLINQYKKQIYDKEFEIIVVDNASKDGSVQSFKTIKEIILIENKENFGFSKGNNIGAKKASGKYILFLNSDTEVKDKGILGMIDFLEQNPKVGILGGKLLNSDGSIQPSSEKFYSLANLIVVLLGGERAGLIRKNPNSLEKVDAVSGASLMIRRNLFEELKGFDENFFMYMEDMEICYRAEKKGFYTYFFPEIELIHKELGSSNRSFAINQIYKGLLYFYMKHKPYWQYLIVKTFLIAKALVALLIGGITNNSYLKRTYWGALKIA